MLCLCPARFRGEEKVFYYSDSYIPGPIAYIKLQLVIRKQRFVMD